MIGSGIGNNDRQNFQAWYVNILEPLYEDRAAGIASPGYGRYGKENAQDRFKIPRPLFV
jgi:hypothetical protein